MRNSRAVQHRSFRARGAHNLPPVGNVLPRPRLTTDDVAKGQAEVLSGVFGALRSPAKEMARDTGQSERACRNQIAGLNAMNLADFFNACRAVPELAEWGARMMGLSGERLAREVSDGVREITLRIDAAGVRIGERD